MRWDPARHQRGEAGAAHGIDRDPEARAKLIPISPLTSVGRLRIPLVAVSGANDPRVPASEAEQIVESVCANGGPAWHLLAEDEGHGDAKQAISDCACLTQLLFRETNLLATTGRGVGLIDRRRQRAA